MVLGRRASYDKGLNIWKVFCALLLLWLLNEERHKVIMLGKMPCPNAQGSLRAQSHPSFPSGKTHKKLGLRLPCVQVMCLSDE